MKITKKTCFCLSLFTVALFACNKDSGSNTEQLTKNYWRVTDVTFDNVTGTPFSGDVDATLETYSACYLADVEIRFNAGGDWTFSGGDDCAFHDPYTMNGTWTFSPDEETLNVEMGDYSSSWSILSLTKSQLKVQYYDCKSCGGQYDVSFDVTVTYSH